jgi:hypothetical protein
MSRYERRREVGYDVARTAYFVASCGSLLMEYFSRAYRLHTLTPIYLSGSLLMFAVCGGFVSKKFSASLVVDIGVICNGLVFLLQLFPSVY